MRGPHFSRFLITALLSFMTYYPVPVHADLFTYTVTGIGSGTFLGTTFTNAEYSWIGIGDTNNMSLFGGLLPSVPLNSVIFTVTGLGAVTPTAPFMVSSFPGQSQVYFTNASGLASGNVFTNFTSSLSGWTPASAIGPVTVSITGSGSVLTSQGNFQLQVSRLSTFTAAPSAVATTEPASVPLFLAIAIMLVPLSGLIRRQHRMWKPLA